MAVGTRLDWQQGRVASVRDAADSIAEIVIATERPVHPDPGSHIEIRIPSGESRSYSIVRGAPDGSTVTLGVHRSPTSRGGSEYMHRLRAGDAVEIAAPVQNFPLRVGAPRYTLLAGGVGITAIAAMAGVLQRVGADYRLVYVGRSRSRMAFLDELRELHGDRLAAHVDDEGSGLDVAALIDGTDPLTELYMCGPIRLMDAVRRAWLDRGLPPANLRYETFGNSGWFDAQEFVVRVPELGIEQTVGVGETMLDALERAGAEPMYDCRKGECGLCQIDVIAVEGAIDHRDVFLSERQKGEAKRICACVSRMAAPDGATGACAATVVLGRP